MHAALRCDEHHLTGCEAIATDEAGHEVGGLYLGSEGCRNAAEPIHSSASVSWMVCNLVAEGLSTRDCVTLHLRHTHDAFYSSARL